jgi:exonuclease SbcC
MIIESLVMKNFKSHKDTSIDFNTGITIIMGGNGAGKSSILEAVSFALFKQHSSKKIEQLITIGNNKNKLYVRLEFTSNGRTYRVTRERSKTASKASITIKEGQGFQQLAAGDTQVTREIQSILEMDGDLFLNAVYVRQGEIADLVDKTPSEKKQVIGKLLGIESLEIAWKNMLPIITAYNEDKTRLEGKLENVESIKEDINSAMKEKTRLEDEIKEINFKIDKIQHKLDSMNKNNEKLKMDEKNFEKTSMMLDTKYQMLKKLEEDQSHLESQLNEINNNEIEMTKIAPKLPKLELLISLKSSLEQLKEIQKERNRIEEALERVRDLEENINNNKRFKDDYDAVSDEIDNIQTKRSEFEGSRELLKQNVKRKEQTLEKMGISHNKIVKLLNNANKLLETNFTMIEELEKHLKTLKPQTKDEINELDTKINQLKEDISVLKTQSNDLQKPINELEYVKEKCPICKSDIDEAKRNELINGYQTQIELNKTKISSFLSALNMFTAKKAILESKYSAIQDINIDVMKEQLENIRYGQQEIKTIINSIKTLEINVLSLDAIDVELKEKQDILKDLKPKYEEYLDAQGSLKSMGDPTQIKTNLKDVDDNLSMIKDRISSLIEMIGGSVENLEEEIEYFTDLKSRYQHLSGAVAIKESSIMRMEQVQNSIEDTKNLISHLKEELENLSYEKEVHVKLIENIQTTQHELSGLNGKKQELIGMDNSTEKNLKGLIERLESYKSFQKELILLKDFIKLLKYIRSAYGKDGVQKDLRDISRPLIEQNTREFFEKFNFEYSDIKLDNEYDITVYGPAGESNLDMISGGEKIAVALALRLGITQTLSGGSLELIMLDEPTIHLDAYRRQELIDLLKRMSIIPQMIIVTHDSDLEDAADNILKVEKEEGISVVHP